jgi:ABC-type Fe3+-hydroxamate transport system substrate-binding protein
MTNRFIKVVFALIIGITIILGTLGCNSKTKQTISPTLSATSSTTAPQAATRTVTDIAGRKVVVPTVVKRIVTLHPIPDYLIGDLLGNQKKGNELANHWHNLIKRVTDAVATVPKAERAKVYYASHDGPLTTVGTATVQSSIIKLAGGIDYATVNKNLLKQLADTDEHFNLIADRRDT